MTYGLFDTTDACWLGTDHGPFALADEAVARQAKELLCERLNWPASRVEVRASAKAECKRDEIAYEKMVGEAVDAITLRWLSEKTGISVDRLRRIESGAVIQSREEDRLLREASNPAAPAA